jgi:peptidoglycan/LPS O-acetylase OafA/YrhL
VRETSAGLRFDLRDSSVLKAIGILTIVLHNFFHLLPAAATENEFDFDPRRFRYFLTLVQEPQHTIQALLAYFGHFGVQLFIFLSAYGLAAKHWTVPSWSGFVWSRVKKIYPMWFLVLGLYLLLKLVQDGPVGLGHFLQSQGDELVLTTLGVITLLPGYGLPPVGPWWFLPFIIQFYCIWSLLGWFARRFGGAGLVILSTVCLGITMAFGATVGSRYGGTLLTTPVGHMPELCLGIASARFGLRLGPATALAAAGFFLLGNLSMWFWPLTYISALVLLLFAYQRAPEWLRRARALEWIGGVSMALFFVNGYLRGLFWPVGRSGVWYLQLGGGLGAALVSLAVAYALTEVERRITAPRRVPRPRGS